MPNVMAALPNIGGALCSTLVSDIAVFVLKRDVKLQLTHSVQRCKVCLTPTTTVPCSNAAKMRNLLKFAGVPQTTRLISAASGPSHHIVGTCGGDIAA